MLHLAYSDVHITIAGLLLLMSWAAVMGGCIWYLCAPAPEPYVANVFIPFPVPPGVWESAGSLVVIFAHYEDGTDGGRWVTGFGVVCGQDSVMTCSDAFRMLPGESSVEYRAVFADTSDGLVFDWESEGTHATEDKREDSRLYLRMPTGDKRPLRAAALPPEWREGDLWWCVEQENAIIFKREHTKVASGQTISTHRPYLVGSDENAHTAGGPVFDEAGMLVGIAGVTDDGSPCVTAYTVDPRDVIVVSNDVDISSLPN